MDGNTSSKQKHVSVPQRIACLYTENDELFFHRLQAHLKPWERGGYIRWFDPIPAGNNIRQTTQEYVQEADLILLIISPDFFADDQSYLAMQLALAEKNLRQVPVLAVLARVSAWKVSECGDLAALPKNEQAIALWTSAEQAYEHICADLAHLVPAFSFLKNAKTGRPAIFQARDLPEYYVPRPGTLQAIKSALLKQPESQITAPTIALRGAGGYGKTTLAQALCHDTDVQKVFDEGILWVTIGEQSENLLGVVGDLIYTLSHEKPMLDTLVTATSRLAELLAERNLLLVIDDVWDAAQLRPFLQGGKRCARLITTRNELVLPAGTPYLAVDAMQPPEAVDLLRKGLEEEKAQIEEQMLYQLARRLGEWPLLLKLVNGIFRFCVEKGEAPADVLRYINQALDEEGLTFFDDESAQDRSSAVTKTLNISLRQLSSEELARYRELAIFPDGVDIPLATLSQFWQESGGMSRVRCKRLCERLASLSLLLELDLARRTIRLHKVVGAYLRHLARGDMLELHRLFLDTYALNRWSDLPLDEPYLWQHLAAHLLAANRINELLVTIKDGSFLARKTALCGAYVVEIDLDLAGRHALHDPALPQLVRFFRGLGHLLNLCHDIDEIIVTLHTYLLPFPQLAGIRASLESELRHPFLTALHPLPDQPSPALIRTFSGHTGMLRSCAFSPAGKWIVSCSDDGTLKLWDVNTGEELKTFQGHTDSVWGCAVSPSEEWIVSCSCDKTLRIWDVETGRELMTLQGHTQQVNECAISPDGTWIASCSDDKTLKIWDARTGEVRMTLRGVSGHGCAISPDGTWIASYADDERLKIWDARTGEVRMEPDETSGFDCVISSDGVWIVSCDRVWNARTGEVRAMLRGNLSGGLLHSRCAISPDGTWIASTADKMIIIWDAQTGQERATLQGHTHWVSGCAVSPDGAWLLSSALDGTLKLWDTQAIPNQFSQQSQIERITDCAVSPDGAWIASCTFDKQIKIWNMQTGQVQRILDGYALWCAIDPSGTCIFSRGSDKELTLWDAQTGQKRLAWGQMEGITVSGCTVSPSGKWIVLSGWNEKENLLRLLGQKRMTISAGPKPVINFALSPLLHVGNFVSIPGNALDCVISPSENWIVSWSWEKTIRIWDANTGQERMVLRGHTGEVNTCAISPDEKWIVSCSNDQTLRVWDVETGQERLTLRGHMDIVNECAISPDGRWIVSCSQDRTLKLWEASSGTLQASLRVDAFLSSCAFSPDGQHIITGGHGGLYFLTLSGFDIKQDARDRRGRGTSEDERESARHSLSGSNGDVAATPPAPDQQTSTHKNAEAEQAHLNEEKRHRALHVLMAELASRWVEMLADSASSGASAESLAVSADYTHQLREALLRWPGSAIIIDPGALLWQVTAAQRAAPGARVVQFALTGPFAPSLSYNPLKEIRRGTPHELDDLRELASLLIDYPGEKGEAAALLLLAILARYMDDASEPSLLELARFFREPWFYSGMQLISYLSHVDDPTRRGHHFAAVLANEFRQLDDEAFIEAIFQHIRWQLAPFITQPLGERTNSHDLSLSALVGSETFTTLYLTFDERESNWLGPILRLLCSQFARGLRDAATAVPVFITCTGAGVVLMKNAAHLVSGTAKADWDVPTQPLRFTPVLAPTSSPLLPCGHPRRAAARFCPTCGQAVEPLEKTEGLPSSRQESSLRAANALVSEREELVQLTGQARKVLSLAQEEARQFQHYYIGTEHLLLGLLREGEGVAAQVLSGLGVKLNTLRSAVEFIVGCGDRSMPGEIDLTPQAEKVIELAADEAQRLHHHSIGTEHLLLGLLREGEGIAAGVLEALDVKLEEVRAHTIQVLNESRN